MSQERRFTVDQFGDEVRRIIVVAAHPDDMETGCGGTIRLLVDFGIEVNLLLCTDGDIGTHDPTVSRVALAATRRAESVAAAETLGVRDITFLGRPDGELVPDLVLRAEVAAVYRRLQPDTLFTFDPYWRGQAHADHTAAGRVAIDAYMPSKMELYHPEQLSDQVKVADLKRVFFFGGSDREGEIVIDIAGTWEAKVRATRQHASQFGQEEEALEWLAAWNREVGKCCGLEYAESFYSMQVW